MPRKHPVFLAQAGRIFQCTAALRSLRDSPGNETACGGIVVVQRFRHRGGVFRAVGLFRGRCHRPLKRAIV